MKFVAAFTCRQSARHLAKTSLHVPSRSGLAPRPRSPPLSFSTTTVTNHELLQNITDPSSQQELVEEPKIIDKLQPQDSRRRTDASTDDNNNNKRKKNRRRRDYVEYAPPPSPQEFSEQSFEDRDFFRFEILHASQKSGSLARVGRIHTPHGIIDTPGFVAVATNAALKGVDFIDADAAGQQLIFSNTYHLMLHPGADIIEEAGGIHEFTKRRDRPFITDSGGFQVFSLAYGSVHEELTSKGELKKSGGKNKRNSLPHDAGDSVKVSEQGVIFRSYRDGSKFLLTPETTVQAQKQIGADIIIPLDELPGYHVDREDLVESVDRTHRWEARSLQEHLRDIKQQAMYCVVHGGLDPELRTKSVNYLTSLPFDGYAIGGSLGDGREELKGLLSWLMPQFDNLDDKKRNKPRHLLGISDEESVWNAVAMGLDTMDSAYTTRLGRHGTLMTRKEGLIKINSGRHKRSFGVKIDDECHCKTCQTYDRAYLWHLFKSNEPLATPLATLHNIQYMNDLMARLRQDIMNDLIWWTENDNHRSIKYWQKLFP